MLGLTEFPSNLSIVYTLYQYTQCAEVIFYEFCDNLAVGPVGWVTKLITQSCVI